MRTLQGGFTISRLENGDLDIASVLPQVRLFAGLPPEALDAIASITTTFHAYRGQTIIEEGDPARELFVVLSGRVRIQIESITPYVEVGITRLGSGEVAGEIALLSEEPRSATAIAMEPCELARIPAGELRTLVNAHPEWGRIVMENLAHVLANRLNSMNRRILNFIRIRNY